MATTTINLGLSLAGLNDVFIHKETTPSAPVTGTLTETQVYALTIPANSFSASDKIFLTGLLATKVGAAGTATLRVKLSTSSTMPAGTTGRIADPALAAANLFGRANRHFNLVSGNIIGYPNNGGALDDTSAGGATALIAFNPTVTNYLYISVILGNTGDSVTVHGYTLKNF
jgi:hypothetical protein